jgi:hypothetical protein
MPDADSIGSCKLVTQCAGHDSIQTFADQPHRRSPRPQKAKTLTGLAGTEPDVGAQHREAQRLQWFLSESNWDAEKINGRRLEVLKEDPATRPPGRTRAEC